MLRITVAVVGAAMLVLGMVLGLLANGAFFELAGAGLIVLAAVLFEARRYRARTSRATGWVDTPEKFVDPTTGKLMRVRYNPETGERDYVEAEAPQRSDR